LTAETPESTRPVYSMSAGLADFLGSNRITLAISSYQSGRFYLISQNADGGLMVHERLFRKAMGICVRDADTVYLATLFQVLKFRNILGPGKLINGTFDACYVPRQTFITGDLDIHDLGVLSDGRIVFVNTLYNCLATTDERHSFRPIWWPSFISRIVKEDRCHLNGLAMDKGVVRYATAVSRSDTIDGWRDRRAHGGVVIDVQSDAIVCDGLSMPHSPRMHGGRLWVLNSGTGELGWIEQETRSRSTAFRPIAFCPGFARGLGFHRDFAFVGLSKPRYQRFEGLQLDRTLTETDSEPWCGVQVIDLRDGTCAHWFRIDGAVSELYDVAVVPGKVRPMALGFTSGEILELVTYEEEGPHVPVSCP